MQVLPANDAVLLARSKMNRWGTRFVDADIDAAYSRYTYQKYGAKNTRKLQRLMVPVLVVLLLLYFEFGPLQHVLDGGSNYRFAVFTMFKVLLILPALIQCAPFRGWLCAQPGLTKDIAIFTTTILSMVAGCWAHYHITVTTCCILL